MNLFGVGYGFLREVQSEGFIPKENDYGLMEREFENFIFF